jgi:hypothetical protein
MNIYLVCYLAITWVGDHSSPLPTHKDIAVTQCDVVTATELTHASMLEIESELSERYDIDEALVTSVSVYQNRTWKALPRVP